MKNSELEETIYNFGNIMYRLGRMETDGRDTMKEYNQALKKKEELMKEIDQFFKLKN